jgi:hypothetical protein
MGFEGVTFSCVVQVKLSLHFVKHHAMKTYRGVEVQLHAFLTWALDGSEWSSSRRGPFIPRAGLDTVAKKKVPKSAGNRALIVQPVE